VLFSGTRPRSSPKLHQRWPHKPMSGPRGEVHGGFPLPRRGKVGLLGQLDLGDEVVGFGDLGMVRRNSGRQISERSFKSKLIASASV
jgi:hypothetical protein